MCDKETRGNNIYYKEIKFKLSHNLKVVGSNPTPATNYSIKSTSYATSKISVFGVFLRFKPDNDYRVINKVINVRQAYSPFFEIIVA